MEAGSCLCNKDFAHTCSVFAPGHIVHDTDCSGQVAGAHHACSNVGTKHSEGPVGMHFVLLCINQLKPIQYLHPSAMLEVIKYKLYLSSNPI